MKSLWNILDFDEFCTTFQFKIWEPFLVNHQKTIFMITEDNPDAYEIKAIKNFESKKKKGGMEFVPLDSLR